MTTLDAALTKAKPDANGSRTAVCWLEPVGNLMAFMDRGDEEPRVLVLTYTTDREAVQALLADWRQVADLKGWQPE